MFKSAHANETKNMVSDFLSKKTRMGRNFTEDTILHLQIVGNILVVDD